ncbi:Ig-like domain-containing protein [Gemmatimonas sp.]|uniref:Ig-like domain-containing protein n=1 Tax=Gemmatimonas sp. TaxID=1962908 RepID=UPI0022C49C16|nr:Ig-like domain-containing protein [Gemmatimonas sp.]MCZ8205737.1 Ig-like domain-containing protein [Gemmatimonas sp.]
MLIALVSASIAAVQPPSAAKLEITPANPVVIAEDTLRLRARVLDANGQPVPGSTIRFIAAGGRFEGAIDADGLVRSGSTGTMPVTVVAQIVGQPTITQRIEVRMVPGPAATITLDDAPTRLVGGQRLVLVPTVRSAAGDRRDDRVQWSSSNPAVVAVNADGLVEAKGVGRAVLTARVDRATATHAVQVVAGRIGSLAITPSAKEARTGDVIRFAVTARDAAGRSLAGLTPSWSFKPGQGVIDADGAFTGYEGGTYVVTATLGTQSAQAVVRLTPRDVRRPATVVGRLPRTGFTTEEVWLHPTREIAYLGTGSGGDRMFTIDITDKSKPVVTDSIVENTRRVNDIMTNPAGTHLVFTREGASDRKNGIVIAALDDPLHPKKCADYTEGLTGGVHSTFVYRQEKYGTHIYLTNDGTGAIHIIDWNDPCQPKTAAVWKTPRPDAGRSLHDIDVQDGLAYLSYWNDGLVILDIGNGIKGGSPSNPQLVSQYKYDLNDMYRQVEASGGPGFIRGTHTAWRHKNYVFIADEVFPAAPVKGAKDASAGRAYGRLQVIDVSNIAKPKSVAFYEPEFGGVHNVWVAGDTLYMGAYNAGFRTFDISGELRGDLRAQQREMVHVHTADMDGYVKNAAMTWGVVVRNGLAYVNDMYNGLWIVRMDPKPEPKKTVIVP